MSQTVAELSARYEANQRAKAYVGWLKRLAAHGGDAAAAAREIRATQPGGHASELLQRAAVSAGALTDSAFGGPLGPLAPLASAYLSLLRPRIVLDRLPGLRQAPAHIKFPTQTAATSVGWTADGAPVQATALAYETTELPARKIAGLVVMSQELARSSDPKAEALFERDLGDSIAAFCDRQLLDPTVAAVGETSPASITHNATSVTPSGTTAAAFRADLAELIRRMTADGCVFASPAWVMSPRMAMTLALMGIDPALSLTGGTLIGAPVIPTTGAATNGDSPDGEQITLIDGAGVTFSDDGLDISASTQGDVEMSTTPSSPPTASTVLTSLWQSGLVGLMATRHVNWTAAPGAVGYIAGAAYQPE